MDPITAGAIGSAVIGGGAQLMGVNRANRMARKEARRNRRFQERMRNTQWQAAVSDMQAAGLNPALAYSQGPNAAPAGSTAQQRDAIAPTVSSATQAARTTKELELLDKQIAKVEGESISSQAKGRLDAWRAGRLINLQLDGEDKQLIERLIQAEVGGAEAGARRTGAQADLMAPMAGISNAFLPIILALSKQSAGGLQLGASSAGSISRMLKFEGGRLVRRAGRAVKNNWKRRN